MKSIFDYLKQNSIRNPSKTAIILENKEISYSELLKLTINTVKNFRRLKISSSSKIFLIEDNSLSHVVTLLAASFLNSCVIPVNTYYSKKHLIRIIKSIKIDSLIGDYDSCNFFNKKIGIKKIICTERNKKFLYFFEKNTSKKN